MSDVGPGRPDPAGGGWDEQFTVPVPAGPAAPAAPAAPAGPAGAAGPATQAIPRFEPTQAIPRSEPTRELATVPPVPPNPYAGQPVWPAGTTSRAGAPDPDVDPLLGQIGLALFWVTVGWWLFVVVRLLGWFTRNGLTDTILIRTIDRGAEETVVAAVLSVLAALLLLLGRGRRGRDVLGWVSLALAVVTVAVAVWRVVP
jgi:hypothetical protein